MGGAVGPGPGVDAIAAVVSVSIDAPRNVLRTKRPNAQAISTPATISPRAQRAFPRARLRQPFRRDGEFMRQRRELGRHWSGRRPVPAVLVAERTGRPAQNASG